MVLGTAQLVEPYGVVPTRRPNKPPDIEAAHATLLEASNLGFMAVDTAPLYGDSEQVIGTSRWSGPVWTKLDPRLSPMESVHHSLRSLRRSWIDVVFVHDVSHLLRLRKQDLADLRSLFDGTVGVIAVSVYEVHEVIKALDVIDFRVVQVPVNVFDSRFEEAIGSGELPEDLTYVARSALLQGALSDPRQAVRRVSPRLGRELQQWMDFCTSLDLPPGEVALAWVLSRPFVDSVIVGAEGPHQLRELAAWSESERVAEVLESIRTINLWPDSDPRTWPSSHEGALGQQWRVKS